MCPMHCERHYLTPLMEPESIVLIGASEREGSVGATLARNQLEAGYGGRLFFINPRHRTLFGEACYPNLRDTPLEKAPDLAVLCTALHHMPDIIESCGHAGIRYAVALPTSPQESGPKKSELEHRLLARARHYGLRLLGPDSLGLLRPRAGINLTYTRSHAIAGHIGLISQSGALCSAVLDWAQAHHVGFSSVISLGHSGDLDFGETLDYLANDPQTRSIFLHIENIRNARRFMSALRAAARCKPVLLIKAGRHLSPARGKTTEYDTVFDAAMRRAGVVRIATAGQMYATAQALHSRFQPRGNRLSILTNGLGLGAMAADYAESIGIPMGQLTPTTLQKFDKHLPASAPCGNPVNLGTDARPSHYINALKLLQEDEQIDGILAILAPHPASDPSQTARLMIEQTKHSSKPLITCWMGETQVTEARRLFNGAAIPSLRTPESALELFSHLSQYFHNQKLLLHTPAAMAEKPEDSPPTRPEHARSLIETALSEKQRSLENAEAGAVLAAFGIPIELSSSWQARGNELRIAIIQDKLFGPAITLGPAGELPESCGNPNRLSVALPPLNEALIDDLLHALPRTHKKDIDLTVVKPLLLRLSEMICELPKLREMEIDPLQHTPRGWQAKHIRLTLAPLPPHVGPYDHMAIHPYPSTLLTHFQPPRGNPITLRPITPQDAALEQDFVQRLSPQSRYFRFMNSLRELSPVQLARSTQIDYDHEMALIATTPDDSTGLTRQIGEARYATNPDGISCEFAIAVADDWQGQGLAQHMMKTLIDIARKHPRLKTMHGDFLNDNQRMLTFVEHLGFTTAAHPQENGMKRGTLPLK